MPSEKFTEDLTLREMRNSIGKNDWGYIFPQGDVGDFKKLKECLEKAGGKPDTCELKDYSKGGNGKAQPEYIITFDKRTDTIIVVECKRSIKEHASKTLSYPKKYAVDGALYYAKFLKDEYNVIAVAISGTSKDNFKASTYYWRKQQEEYQQYKKATDIILEPLNYLKLVNC
jgi:hypothetical protein